MVGSELCWQIIFFVIDDSSIYIYNMYSIIWQNELKSLVALKKAQGIPSAPSCISEGRPYIERFYLSFWPYKEVFYFQEIKFFLTVYLLRRKKSKIKYLFVTLQFFSQCMALELEKHFQFNYSILTFYTLNFFLLILMDDLPK